ncbi:hypothetical protein CLV48_108179 [Cecembia rubra]|uniref:Uncharacterized protein n=1 Tax=Cecembia rubra TaxID=1485585 RepID=A0A2P8E0T9_9BACT|nr:hypothetical protein CLV48_108179 [Cecembia rubra]
MCTMLLCGYKKDNPENALTIVNKKIVSPPRHIDHIAVELNFSDDVFIVEGFLCALCCYVVLKKILQ